MVSAHGLARHFGRFAAVDSIDFRIPRGQVVGFLGPNGAGKTTAIRMIAGILPPTQGRITVDGLDAFRHGPRVRQRIGYLAELAPMYGEMRVSEFLRFRARLYAVPRRQRSAAIELAAGRCSLGAVLRRPIHQLSRGYRQRVALAAALVHEPPLLILDEPTTGLDPSQLVEFRQLVRHLAPRHTILLSTHMLPEVEQTCDRVLLMARGRIWADGTIDELRRSGEATGTVRVEVAAGADARAASAIRDLSGVERIEVADLEDGWRQLTVQPRSGAGDLREPIAAALAAAGCPIRELYRPVPTLEELFVRVVARAEAGDAAPPPARGASA